MTGLAFRIRKYRVLLGCPESEASSCFYIIFLFTNLYFLLQSTWTVIHCQCQSEREVQDNSPIIVSSNGAKSHEITIESSVPVSNLGGITFSPMTTYPFNLVFGLGP
jgi:hypothetical protein